MSNVVIERRRSARLAAPASPERASNRRLLWGPDDLLRWAFAIFAGAIVIGVAWYVGAGDLSLKQQIGPTDAAVAGLLLSGLGNATWLLRGRRAVGERRRSLLPDPVAQVQRVRLLRGTASEPVAQTEPAHSPILGDPVFLAGPNMERFHHPNCALAAG